MKWAKPSRVNLSERVRSGLDATTHKLQMIERPSREDTVTGKTGTFLEFFLHVFLRFMALHVGETGVKNLHFSRLVRQ
jgi:hypothetical protein